MKLGLLTILISISAQLVGQNLVFNHDFSTVNPNNQSIGLFASSIESMSGWYYHRAQNGHNNKGFGSAHDTACVLMPLQGGCPGTYTNTNYVKYFTPLPYEGRGMAKLRCYSNVLFVGNQSTTTSIILTRLKSILEADTTYCTEMSIRFIDGKIGGYSCYTHDGMGMFLGPDSSLATSQPWNIGITPQSSGYGYITNKDSWRKLKGNFVANGDEEYLFIGNFDPISTPPLQIGTSNVCDSIGDVLVDAIYVYNCRDTLFSVYHKDTTVCFGQPVTLAPKISGFKLQDSTMSYHWQTPSGSFSTPDSTLVANEPGLYTVEVEINHRFKSTTTFYVYWVPEPPDSNFLQSQYTLCAGDNLRLSVPQIPKAHYVWSNSDTTHFTAIQQPGSYELTVTTPCWQHTETFFIEQQSCEVRLFVPNSFTPNGDGTNDFFVLHCTEEPIKLWVFDRWGNTVYHSNNYQNNWDGTYNGQILPTGAYTYLIEFEYINPNATQIDPNGSKRQKRGVVNILP